jgi:hypothetical protein
VTTSDDGRGGSVPPRPPAGKPQQLFTLRPWVFDVTMAGVLLRAEPRPPRMVPVAGWSRAYGLAREPGSARHAISLIGPGPDFSPEYAMTTDPDDPVILATLGGAHGESPLLIDGYALPVIVRCCTEAHGRGLSDDVGILSGLLRAGRLGLPGGYSGGP